MSADRTKKWVSSSTLLTARFTGRSGGDPGSTAPGVLFDVSDTSARRDTPSRDLRASPKRNRIAATAARRRIRDDDAPDQRQANDRPRYTRHSLALGVARPRPPHRHQVRLRHGTLRRLYRPPRRRGRTLVPDADLRGHGQEDHHDRRGRRFEGRQGGAERLALDRRTAMRLLSGRSDHDRDGATRA